MPLAILEQICFPTYQVRLAKSMSSVNEPLTIPEYIAPTVMIPEHRLAVLLNQFQEERTSKCLFHNTADPPSLYHEHVCDREEFPLCMNSTLSDHNEEVWTMEFSNDGKLLATGGRSHNILIYETNTWKVVQRLRHPDHEHGGRDIGISYFSWSPNSRYLISCSRAYNLMIWDIRACRSCGLYLRLY